MDQTIALEEVAVDQETAVGQEIAQMIVELIWIPLLQEMLH